MTKSATGPIPAITEQIYMVAPIADINEANRAAWRWRALGYKVIYLADTKTTKEENKLKKLVDDGVIETYLYVENYRGWYASCNLLMGIAFSRGATWCVCVGTDMDPDQTMTAQSIASTLDVNRVMQPCGDRWDIKDGKAASERICGSPWISKTFYENKAKKVWDERFFHYYGDEKLHDELGDELLQRFDLTHLHHHPNREGRAKPGYLGRSWREDQRKFVGWKKTGK